MKRKLTINNNFTPCKVDIGDELFPNGIFEFNITKLLEHIKENQNDFTILQFETKDFIEDFSSFNEAHLESVDISQPIILAEISPWKYNIIDGNHRVEKARRMGVKSVSAYTLNVKDHINFLTTQKAYISYIKYWNSKQED